MRSLQGELAELLRIHGVERFVHALRPLLTDTPDFVSQLQGGEIWALTEFQVLPRRHMRKIMEQVHTAATVAGLMCQTMRMPYGRLTVGLRGPRQDVSRVLTSLQLMQSRMYPRTELVVSPATGKWTIQLAQPEPGSGIVVPNDHGV